MKTKVNFVVLFATSSLSILTYLVGISAGNIFGKTSNNLNNFYKSEEPPLYDPPDRGKPSNTTNGSERGDCEELVASPIALTPLTPDNQDPGISQLPEGFTYTMGWTIEEYPTFWVYLPEISSNLKTAHFKIQNLIEDPIEIALPGEVGIFYFRLPLGKPLPIGNEYQWYFSLVCDPTSPAKNPTVNSWIERIDPTQLQQELALSDDEESHIYARNGIWHETIAQLAEQKCQNPQDPIVSQNWREFLVQVGFEEIANETLHCSPLVVK
ncbi:DUF928 domain-containing protein [Oxynema sp. CENA135]|uniref:DUF928 domain-containing protein n=1 Tax=Oxynema sp. CENA135 TaxID=984206 RepID=UPI0019097E1B|nr:DUF928 domain-containing protein [Oxynema sp. CENA135]MBK4732620.1 DUF928 domain-containing protein [Oxynema sp. CENA135]